MIEIEAMFPVMVTTDLEAVKQYYELVFGFKAVFFQPDFYLHLLAPDSGVQLGFLMPGHESQPRVFASDDGVRRLRDFAGSKECRGGLRYSLKQ